MDESKSPNQKDSSNEDTEKRNNPFGEEQKHGDPQKRREPGSDADGDANRRRAPGAGEPDTSDEDTQDNDRKIA